MTFNLARGIFGTLEASPQETATAEDIAAALQWPLPAVRRKLRDLAGYVTDNGDGTYTLSHEFD